MLYRYIIIVLCALLANQAQAQDDLQIGSLLAKEEVSIDTKKTWTNESSKSQWSSKYGGKNVTLIHLRGNSLPDYDLKVFKSLTMIPSDSISYEIERKIIEDIKEATKHEVSYRDSRLYYGLFQLPHKAGYKKRYIFYRNNALHQNTDGMLTLIYMEGSASIHQLRKMFKK